MEKFFYDKIKYILFKEIKKISDINYRCKILEKILEENELIKKSNDIFQFLLKNCLRNDDRFRENRNNILNGNDYIIKFIEKKLTENNFVLAQALLYLFEKNALIYLNNTLNNKKFEKNL